MGTWYQVTASGTDHVPLDLEEQYKEWVIQQTPKVLQRKELEWHDKIYELHQRLEKLGIKHIFFNSYNYFGNVKEHYDWNDCYIDPYEQANTYWHWCQQKGFECVNGGYHYGKDAHVAWAKYLLPRLTEVTSSSNIISAKKAKIDTNLRVFK